MADSNGNGAVEHGYNGRMLVVDLTAGTITEERPDESLYREYLGGYGIGARLLWDRVPSGDRKSVV